jgi:hypothetical protein
MVKTKEMSLHNKTKELVIEFAEMCGVFIEDSEYKGSSIVEDSLIICYETLKDGDFIAQQLDVPLLDYLTFLHLKK